MDVRSEEAPCDPTERVRKSVFGVCNRRKKREREKARKTETERGGRRRRRSNCRFTSALGTHQVPKRTSSATSGRAGAGGGLGAIRKFRRALATTHPRDIIAYRGHYGVLRTENRSYPLAFIPRQKFQSPVDREQDYRSSCWVRMGWAHP